jgi:hypothetical protein
MPFIQMTDFRLDAKRTKPLRANDHETSESEEFSLGA